MSEFVDKVDRVGDITDPDQWLSACRYYARTHAPYFAAALIGLVPKETPGLGTFGVTKGSILVWDPAMAKVWSVRKGATVFIHEVGHIVRNHHDRRGDRDPFLWNYAADAEINDDIQGESWDVDDDWITPKSLGYEDGMLAEAYYQKIVEDDKIKPPTCPGVGQGWCGSGAGNEMPGEPQDEAEGRSAADVSRIRRDVARAVREEASKASGRGNLPGGLARWAEDFLQPPKVPWRQQLRQKVKHAVSWAAGLVNHTYKKPSRRQSGLGYGVGVPILPAFHAPLPHVLIGIDTSGSMGPDELGLALRETNGILKSTRSRVHFAACDAEISGAKKCSQISEITKLLVGGGGTDFRPLFKFADHQSPRPSVVIMMTDGDGACPVDPPKEMKVIWLLVGKHRRDPDVKWGDRIYVDE